MLEASSARFPLESFMKFETRKFLVFFAVTIGFAHFAKQTEAQQNREQTNAAPITPSAENLAPVVKIVKTEAEWKTQLTPEQFAVVRKKGTERAGSSPLLSEHRRGVFHCVACGLPVFASDAKFESGTGWPSFTKPLVPANLAIGKDNSLFMERDEVLCARCGAHLGHVFDDGPQPTGLRYCMNGIALKFEERP